MTPPPSSSPAPVEALSGDEAVLRRPQFARRGELLFFLDSRRPFLTLDAAEAALWDALEGGPSVTALRARFGAGAEAGVRRLVDAGVCDLAVPHRSGRRRVLVVEPHIDDAALSVGGTIWQRRDECEFTVLTIASRSNFTSYFELDRPWFEVEKVSALRRAEAELFARVTGGRHLALGYDEATLRYRGGDWTLDWFRRHRHSVSAFIGHRSGEGELRRWTEGLRAALREIPSDEVWLPLGVGAHTDHELARNACLRALVEEPALAAGRELRLYEEVPYASHDPGYAQRLVRELERAGARLAPEPVRVDDAFETKLRLLTIFGSQFKVEALRAGIEASAELASGGVGRAERLWRLERPPRAVDPLSLYVDAPEIESAAGLLSRWSARHRKARRLRLLLLVPAGRWAEDLELLEGAFPAARFDVFAAAGSEAEVADHPSPRVKLRTLAPGERSWALLSLRLAVSPPVPTLFLAGRKRLALAHRLSRFWPMSDPVVLPSLGHLVTALGRPASR
jgi:LmbE family N-acetylglucosaminyl deacetylase